MKNLIDELHKLDNENFEVSKDFSKNVMKRIKKEKHLNTFNYVVSLASLGIVACLAAVLFTNTDIKNRFLDLTERLNYNNSSNEKQESDATDNIVKDSYDFNSYTDNTNLQDTEASGIDNNNANNNILSEELDSTSVSKESHIVDDEDAFPTALPTAPTESYNAEKISGETPIGGYAVVSKNNLTVLLNEANVEILEINPYSIKVNANKEKLEEVLKNVISDYKIEEAEDGCIISLKEE